MLRAGAEVREAQASVLKGGDRVGLREAMDRRRDIIADLSAAVVEQTDASCRNAAKATFEAASIEHDLAALVQSGRLTAEVTPRSGFAFGDLGDDADEELTAPPPKPDNSKEVKRLEDKVRRAQQELADALSVVENYEALTEQARQHHRSAEQNVRETEEALLQARADL